MAVIFSTNNLLYLYAQISNNKGTCVVFFTDNLLHLCALLPTYVMSTVLFVRVFNVVLLQERTGCSIRYCVSCSSLTGFDVGNLRLVALPVFCRGYLYLAQSGAGLVWHQSY